MKIWANTIVHNEENFVWFAIMSVVDFVDKVLVYDTGSSDKTVEIIKEIKRIKGDKIEFKEIGEVDKQQFTKVRQEMLERSNCDWILILDGDEIWWEDSIKKAREIINKNGKHLDGIVVPMVVPVGDIYHIQEERAGKYQIKGKKGHLSIRLINRKISGLNIDWPYGKEGFFDNENKPIQERDGIIFLDVPIMHVTHLKRSSLKRKYDKFKYEFGARVSSNFKYPEVLYRKYPPLISSPWIRISGIDKVVAKVLAPLRKIKRRII